MPISKQQDAETKTGEAPASEVAPELKLSREQVVRRIQTGALRGRFDSVRGWLVDRASVLEFKQAS